MNQSQKRGADSGYQAKSTDGLNQVVTFIEFHLPGLVAGGYTLNLSQTVANSADEELNDEPLRSEYQLAVVGDRFSFSKPSEIVFGTFPDNNASGEYSNVLPHVVFTNQTFPWSREAQVGDTIMPGRATWLGVLLFDEDDMKDGAWLAPITGKVGDLFPKAAFAKSNLPDTTLSYFRGAKNTEGLQLGQTTDDPLQYIDLPLDLFWKLAPTLEDLHYLSHARRVSLLPKATIPNVTDVGEPVGDFSIVFGNRLPQRLKKSIVFLVSLEEMGDLLPTDSGHPAPGTATHIRLAVLQTWSFFSMGAPADFDERMLALNGRKTGNKPPDAANTNLRLTYEGSNLVVGNALGMGYVPLNQTMRTGEKNVSWYRGPLVSYDVPTGKLKIPIPSPDTVMAFDPTTGLLDESYAAAWSLGRLLALQDKGFSTGLYSWKKGLSATVVQSVEDEILTHRFGTLMNSFEQSVARAKEARSTLEDEKRTGLEDYAQITSRDLRTLLVHTLLEVQ